MNADLWIGAATTLSGAALGGLISFGLSHQQIRESRAQRAEEGRRERTRRIEDRRFISYSEFLTHARSYRNAIRSNSPAGLNAADVDAVAAQADPASSAVFLLTESPATYAACRRVLSAIGRSQEVLHDERKRDDHVLWAEVTLHMIRALRRFQVAARDELSVSGIDPAEFLAIYGDPGNDTGHPNRQPSDP